ncbi:MAG: hypothetical protein P8H63_05380 [Flavobacteriaceae bacterium]|nr:hypothetical protein [Flavobacteriaceae bacterium]
MKTICLLFPFFSLSLLQAQSIGKYSLAIKGTLDPYADSYYAEGVEINAFSRSFVYSLGYISGDEYVSSDYLPKERHTMINALIGKYIDSKNQKFRFQVQTGIGLLLVTKEDVMTFPSNGISVEQTIGPRTLGFPVKVGGRFLPFSFLSIGIDIQANLNSKRSNTRPMLSVEFGNIRSKK